METKWKPIRSGLTWTLFSPLVLLMALISTVESDRTYWGQVVVYGTWSICGVIAGVGRITGTSWAVRLQIILRRIAFIAVGAWVVALIYFLFAASLLVQNR